MRFLRRLTAALLAMVQRKRVDAELDEELREYLAAAVDAKVERGVGREDALRQARGELGSVSAVKDWVQDVGWECRLENVCRDVRYALRTLRRSPGFATVAIMTLALAIGANTAVFSVVNALLLRPLAVEQPDRLVLLSEAVDNATWEHIQERAQPLAGALAWSFPIPLNGARGGEKQLVTAVFASQNFFTVLGVPPVLGRTFPAVSGERDEAGVVAVISHVFWQRQFGGSTDVIGRTLLLEATPVTVIGVAPGSFSGLDVGQRFDAVLPLSAEPLVRGEASHLKTPLSFLRVMLRLRPGQSIAQASTELRHIQRGLPTAGASDQPRFAAVPAGTGTSALRESYERPLLTLLALVGLVLVMASANVANLLLSRGLARQLELGIRLAIGASRGRLIRQLLVEAAVLAACGATLGLVLADWASASLAARIGQDIDPGGLDPTFDWRVLAFTAFAVTVATLLSGALPALRTTTSSGGVLMAYGPQPRGRTAGVSRVPLIWSGCVAVQVALSLVLVIAAALLVRSFDHLSSVPLGFEPARVLVVTVDNPRATRPEAGATTRLHQLVDAVASVPGVAAAGASFVTPVSGVAIVGRVTPPRGAPASDEGEEVYVNVITPGWLAASGIPLRSGRDFDEYDRPGARPVALVNEAFARIHFAGQNAVGEIVRARDAFGTPKERVIVGVTGDIVYGSLREGVVPTVLLPVSQSDGGLPPWGVSITVRTADDPPLALSKSLAAAIDAHDPSLTFAFRPLADQVDAALASERLIANVSALFGGLALLLAAVGLYGVTTYAATQRQFEIGIRTALGALPGDIIRLVITQTLASTAVGIGAGLVAAAALSRYLGSLLFGVGPLDGATFAAVPLLFALIACAAALMPARRATSMPRHTLQS